ncbi:MAG: antibiotic biosynthesis monooxygenase [Planctomycetota bacterium]
MTDRVVGFAVIYRWRLKAGMEAQFAAAWSEVTDQLLQHRGSLGSRLHRGPDEVWYGYAQWPSAEARTAAFADPIASAARQRMLEAIDESLPDILLEPVADYLVLPDSP